MNPLKLITAAFFAMMPTLGFAMCTGHDETANVCQSGYTWDETTQACVEIVSG